MSEDMSKKDLVFGDKKINNNISIKCKQLMNINNVDINKTLISKKESYGIKGTFEPFIGYEDNDDNKPLNIKLPQMIGYVKCFDDGIKNMSFMAKSNDLIEAYNAFWNKVSSLMKREIDSDKYVKIKIKSNNEGTNTKFHGKKIPKENVHCACLSVILLEFVVRVNKKYHPQTLLEACKYEVKKKKNEKSY